MAATNTLKKTKNILQKELKAEPVKTKAASTSTDFKKGKKAKFPATLSPMLATLVDKPFDDDGWQYEVKWDGYRTVAFLNKGKVELRSRNNKSFDEKFYPVKTALEKFTFNAVLDGEIIVANDEGISNFGNLQNWRSEADGALKFYVFDILWLEGYSLMELGLQERREILAQTLPQHDDVLISQTFEATGTEFFTIAGKLGLEGIMAKKIDSTYTPGLRTKEWLKIKTNKRQEVVIGGYTRNTGSSKAFSALLVGVFEKGKLHYTGKIGTGFSDALQKEMMAQFKPLIVDKPPFEEVPDVNKPSRFRPNPPKATATWLQPKLVCEVSFAEITSDGVMRHPSFEGMRIDKNAKDVHEEKEKHVEEVTSASEVKKTSPQAPLRRREEPRRSAAKEFDDTSQKKKDSQKISDKKEPSDKKLKAILKASSKKEERKTLLNPTEKSQKKNINGHDIIFNNLDKIYYPAVKGSKAVTKRDVINYYYQAAPFMLPYMKDRPQTLIRYPNGINGESFYQKDVTGKVPDWIEQFPYSSEAGGDRNFMVVKNEASLLMIASMGGLEMHPWSSRISKPDNPDWCIIDLDPDNNPFNEVIETACVTKQVLDSIDVPGYCKTSGSTGMHIYIPLAAKYTYEHSKEFGRVLATIIHKQLPEFTSVERATKLRKGKLYVDFLQNRPQATLATVYSLRPKPLATVSMPLHWDEVKKGLQMQHFTIHNAVPRIKEVDALFKPVLGKGINIKQALKKITSVFGEQSLHQSLKDL